MTDRITDLFGSRLLGKLTKTVETQSAALANGSATDWSDYKYRAGVLNGLRVAVALCHETDKELGQ